MTIYICTILGYCIAFNSCHAVILSGENVLFLAIMHFKTQIVYLCNRCFQLNLYS